MLGTPSSQHGLFYLRINSSANIPWTKKKKKKKRRRFESFKAFFCLKKISTLRFFEFRKIQPFRSGDEEDDYEEEMI